MKKIVSLLFIAMFCLSTVASAQEGKAAGKLKGSKDRLILELAHDNWLEKPDDIKLKWYNRG